MILYPFFSVGLDTYYRYALTKEKNQVEVFKSVKVYTNDVFLVYKQVYLPKSNNIRQNLTRPGTFYVPFCLRFDHYCQNLISAKETGYQPVPPPNSQLLLLFHYYFLSKIIVLSHWATRIQKCFYQKSSSVLLVQNQTLLERANWQNIMTRIVYKIFIQNLGL